MVMTTQVICDRDPQFKISWEAEFHPKGAIQ